MIGKLLGHNHVHTTARYAHLANDPLRVGGQPNCIPNCRRRWMSDAQLPVVMSIGTGSAGEECEIL